MKKYECEKLTHNLCVALEKEETRRFRLVAKAKHKTPSCLIRELIRKFMDDYAPGAF